MDGEEAEVVPDPRFCLFLAGCDLSRVSKHLVGEIVRDTLRRSWRGFHLSSLRRPARRRRSVGESRCPWGHCRCQRLSPTSSDPRR